MTTPIGQALATSRCKLVIAGVIGLLAVVGDLFLVSQHLWYERGILPVIAVVAFVQLVYGDLSSLGLRVVPIQGWTYWFRLAMWFGFAVIGLVAAWAWALMYWGYDLPVVTISPSSAIVSFWRMCIAAPVVEESIYRFALCVPLAAMLRPWMAIVASGFCFCLLHFVYGNPSPENAIGGFILAWCFLKSGSIYVPVMLHSLGNLFVFSGQVGAWYLLPGNR